MWQTFKNLFSKPEEAVAKSSSEETVRQISEDRNEPVIKNLNLQISYRKTPKFRRSC